MHHEYNDAQWVPWCTMSTHVAPGVRMMHQEHSDQEKSWCIMRTCITKYSWCTMSSHDASWALMTQEKKEPIRFCEMTCLLRWDGLATGILHGLPACVFFLWHLIWGFPPAEEETLERLVHSQKTRNSKYTVFDVSDNRFQWDSVQIDPHVRIIWTCCFERSCT